MAFKVGQVWADGEGGEEIIIAIQPGLHYPIQTRFHNYTTEGRCQGGVTGLHDLVTLISEPNHSPYIPQPEPKRVKMLTLQEVVATLTMDQVVGIEGTDWSWYYHWGIVEGCEIGLVISVDEKPMPMTLSNLTDRHFMIRDKSSIKGKK